MVTGFRNMVTVEMGFDRARVLTFHITLPDEKYPKDATRSAPTTITSFKKFRRLPGVESVSLRDEPAFRVELELDGVHGRRADRQRRPVNVHRQFLQVVTPDFFRTLRVPLLAGKAIYACGQTGCRSGRM